MGKAKLIKVTVGDNLRKLRCEMNLSQSDLAKASGLPPAQISHFECGRRDPSLKSIRKMQAALGCSFDNILIDCVVSP
ncbi:helix-turn-helix domain-containing protein [Thalassospira povalilytica]|uniref:helix-turn-helix domain-containing protein n=1 Tax=Thalassospira povalilytica TaxID=732237 RepID=UPI003AA884B4